MTRPDTYIGSVLHEEMQMWIFDPQKKQFQLKNINFVPGFYKIFDEIIVNAADNKVKR